MDDLTKILQKKTTARRDLPYSIYKSVADQRILNAPIMRPLLICVLSGRKELGTDKKSINAGEFVFLSNTSSIDMRNIAFEAEYLALLIEFDYQDFSSLQVNQTAPRRYFAGPITEVMVTTLTQFVEWAAIAPPQVWPLRRQELLHVIYHMGFEQVCSIVEPPSLTHRLEQLLNSDIKQDLGMSGVASSIAMSESTLRRKLASENSSFQAIKDRVKLSRGLHLLQSSALSIGQIAEECGYQSQSRFTGKFKSLFGLTPSELRKTKMRESGE